jgi:hypothetical protein
MQKAVLLTFANSASLRSLRFKNFIKRKNAKSAKFKKKRKFILPDCLLKSAASRKIRFLFGEKFILRFIHNLNSILLS